MKKLLLVSFFMLTIFLSFSQKLTGTWYGQLSVRGTTLHLVFHISQTAAGYTTVMDSPDQQATGLTADTTIVNDNHISIEAARYKIKYTGNFLPDSNVIHGRFSQGAAEFPLDLSNHSEMKPASAVRPQDPKDFPYIREEVFFNNYKAGIKLAGTLTMPKGGKLSKIVVLISGSGPQNRNEEILQFNHRPFLVWSDWLTRNGIAVLRYDDRGVGQSTGVFANATTADFADDAEAAVNYIQSRTDLNGLAIGLMGHSEGGMIAPMVASRLESIKFLVLLAAPGIPVNQLLVRQTADQLRLTGASTDVVKRASDSQERVTDFIIQNKGLSDASFRIKLDTLLHNEIHEMGDLHGADPEKLIQQNIARLTSPWFRYFVAFNPTDYLLKIQCPVLAVDGTLDMQVSAEPNLNGIKAALQKAGNKKFEIVPIANLNHFLQMAKTGGPEEYGESVETVNPSALQKVSEWIKGL